MQRSIFPLLLCLLVPAAPVVGQLSATGNQLLQEGFGGLIDAAEPNDRFGAALAVGDFNDDGFEDLAIGVPGQNFAGFPHPESLAHGAGAVHIVYGSAMGLTFIGNATFAQQSGGDISGFPEDGDAFGAALAVLDANRDGVDDLVVGEPGSREEGLYWTLPDQAGAITLLQGSSGEGIVDVGAFQFSQSAMYLTCESAEENDRFGAALVGLRLAGDFGELFVGTPGEGVTFGSLGNQGRVQQLSTHTGGSITGGCGNNLDQDQPGVAGTSEDGDRFGGALGQGDFNGDGIADLVIGVVEESIGSSADAGSITIVPGTMGPSGGLAWKATDSISFDQSSPDILGTPGVHDFWGFAFASGDFDRDGFDDLAIGAPGDSEGTGASSGIVQVLYGSPSGVDGAGDQIWSQAGAIVGGAESADAFGSAVAAGDFDGDGTADLAIGVPGENFTSGVGAEGAVNVIYGRLGFGLDAPGNQFWNQDSTGLLGSSEPADAFGQALAVGDFNSDGRDDLAIGVPGENGAAGLVQVLYGSDGGLLGAAEYTTSNVTVVTEATVTLTLLVRRIGPLNLAATVGHRLVPGSSATLGSDFTYTPGTLTWSAGETSAKSFDLTVRADLLREALETFTIELHSPSAGFGLGPRTRRTVQINDND